MLRRPCDSVYGAHGDIAASYIGCLFLHEFCTSLPDYTRCIPLHSLYGATLYPKEIPEDAPIQEEPESLSVTPQGPEDTATEVEPEPAQHEGSFRRAMWTWLSDHRGSDNMASPPTEGEEERPQDIVDLQESPAQAAPQSTPEWQRWEDEDYADSEWAVAWPEDYELSHISPKYPPGIVIREIPKPKPAPRPKPMPEPVEVREQEMTAAAEMPKTKAVHPAPEQERQEYRPRMRM